MTSQTCARSDRRPEVQWQTSCARSPTFWDLHESTVIKMTLLEESGASASSGHRGDISANACSCVFTLLTGTSAAMRSGRW
jgi:hypothetical protein